MTTMTPWRYRITLLLSGLLLTTGCGGAPAAPVDEVPQLADRLARVDSAVAEHRYARARRRLNDLVDTTVAAREAGELEPEQADQVLAAAAHLMSALPKRRIPRHTPTPRPELARQPAPQSEDRHETSEDWEKKQEKLAKKLEEERKKLEEEQKKEEEKGSGNGDSSDNGPDDGEGD